MERIAENLQSRMLVLADDLDRKAEVAAQIHAELRASDEWGTGVTQRTERQLTELANSYRDLVRIDREG